MRTLKGQIRYFNMCIIDKNKVLETPVKDILFILKQRLDAHNIDKLNDIHIHGDNALITCPHHKGGVESTPSCSILLVDKGKIPAGTVNCFACGYKANLVKFVADCFDISYRGATEWLLNFVNYSFISDIRDVDILNFDSHVDNNYSELPKVTIEELRSYDYIHPYMFKRHLNDWAINKFEIGYDRQKDALTFPVYVNGDCLFIARRYVKYKRFDMPKIHPKPIYGVDYLTDDEVVVCESIFNAITCWMYGRQAIALFGTGSNEQIEQLKNLPQRKIILALDGDEAGKNGINKILNKVDNKIITVLKTPEDGRDINDLTKEEFDSLEEMF